MIWIDYFFYHLLNSSIFQNRTTRTHGCRKAENETWIADVSCREFILSKISFTSSSCAVSAFYSFKKSCDPRHVAIPTSRSPKAHANHGMTLPLCLCQKLLPSPLVRAPSFFKPSKFYQLQHMRAPGLSENHSALIMSFGVEEICAFSKTKHY